MSSFSGDSCFLGEVFMEDSHEFFVMLARW